MKTQEQIILDWTFAYLTEHHADMLKWKYGVFTSKCVIEDIIQKAPPHRQARRRLLAIFSGFVQFMYGYGDQVEVGCQHAQVLFGIYHAGFLNPGPESTADTKAKLKGVKK